jgi:malate dehydrogenase (oxaloacetate-decarboxylating)(NADP+)
VNATDKEDFINCVKFLGPSFAGINLEDIKGPDCFYVEERLKQLMDIPIFHDDQHGTAIVCLAGLINACEIKGKKFEDIKIVVNGAGAAGIACLNLIIKYGANPKKCILVDTIGVCYKGRTKGMNEFKDRLAIETEARTLEDACVGADVLIGVSAPRVFEKVLKTLNKDPIIFAMSNPEPEVRPEIAKNVRPDCIIATGRSDYPNQINNVMCFPFLFRATLDVRAKQINEEMKMAAAMALAELAKKPVPESVKKAIPGREFNFGPDYIIPTPFDPRLIFELPCAIAKAAIDSGIAKKPITDFNQYRSELGERMGYKMQKTSVEVQALAKM